MKIQYSFLKNFLNTNLSQKKLCDVFTQVGFECEIEGDLIEFDITPNRGDALSLRGLEREFYAYQSKKPSQKIETSSLRLFKDKKIINQIDGSGCGNYYLMLVKGLQKIKNLDSKKRSFIESAGIPLINPLVDLGNYVMLELGAPTHVFDLAKLTLPINVRFPQDKNNSVKVIGGDLKDVQPSSLTIQDQSGIQAIAGIIGSEVSSVSLSTSSIAVEAAFFRPEVIVNQARKYGLATDASHRFERGVDPEIQQSALERYLFLLDQIAKYDSVELYYSYSKKTKKKNVKLDVARFNKFSGLNLKASKAILILKNLGFKVHAKSEKNIIFNIPSHRFDVSLEEDLYEELLRSYGYDNIPISKPKAGPITNNKRTNALGNLRLGLVHSGFKELMHMPFVSRDSFHQLNSYGWKPAELQNPINENEPLLRGSLFRSLFVATNSNIKKGHMSIKAFEVGNVFKKEKNGFSQLLHLSGIVYYHEPQQTWGQRVLVYDFFSLKAEISKLLQTLGMQNIEFQKASALAPFNENALDIFIGKQKIAVMGEIDLSVTEKLIKKQAYGFVIYPDKIPLSSVNPKIAKTSKFPISTRDINIVIDKSISYKEVESLISQAAINHLVSFNLINIFEGKDIPKGSVSMTLRFIFKSMTKSLLESEINYSIQMILKLLEKKLNAKIRS
ncbi:phenylalanine--tRNA ligase subunit beta [Gammaproteobacteria bacterium]|nr:phenylalanine--tRNA ligase subunit beta [Gammaproteobacteria bacterium]MDA8798648.1 phenylalanine--tRNA ligase subunit beta [Gammaproteobacteria bacterium]MDC0919286.1 phenylalanine--tRNA ligase subunit beta [Gammaproteobacteria bacterium]